MQEIKLEPNEKWIPGFEGFYSLTEDGRIFKYEKTKKESLVNKSKKSISYTVTMRGKTYNLITVYAKTFVPNLNNCNKAKIKDKSKTHFSIDNIIWYNQKKSNLKMIYTNMINRCYNKNDKGYKNYGGRGITVSDEWRNSFENFKNDDMGEREDGYSIDRIDVNKGYSKENCRWLSMKEQQNNKRDNTIIEYNGERRTLSEWSDYLNIKRMTLTERLRRGWSIEKTLTTKVDPSQSFRY